MLLDPWRVLYEPSTNQLQNIPHKIFINELEAEQSRTRTQGLRNDGKILFLCWGQYKGSILPSKDCRR